MLCGWIEPQGSRLTILADHILHPPLHRYGCLICPNTTPLSRSTSMLLQSLHQNLGNPFGRLKKKCAVPALVATMFYYLAMGVASRAT
jgi:hypothetical protein